MKGLDTISHETNDVKRQLEAVRLSIRNREAGLETDRANEAKLLAKLAELKAASDAVFAEIEGAPMQTGSVFGDPDAGTESNGRYL